jgi:sugar phosphate isomerase/epimerase
VRAFKEKIATSGLKISAVSNHQDGQLLLGPHHRDTDRIHTGSPKEKINYALDRLIRSARLAAELEVGLVVGFVGCADYARFFPWPDPKGWESMAANFQDRVGRLMDEFETLGVSFGQEPHPKQIVYNTETALESVGWLNGHKRWGFNLDPANLLLAGVDPVVFVKELKGRIFHVHAKDGELVVHNAARSGLLAHGAWDRPDRGFRFRIPGWGDVPWKRLISELILSGYDGYLAVENEDPLFNPLDGLRKAVDEIRPLLPRGQREKKWWC